MPEKNAPDDEILLTLDPAKVEQLVTAWWGSVEADGLLGLLNHMDAAITIAVQCAANIMMATPPDALADTTDQLMRVLDRHLKSTSFMYASTSRTKH